MRIPACLPFSELINIATVSAAYLKVVRDNLFDFPRAVR